MLSIRRAFALRLVAPPGDVKDVTLRLSLAFAKLVAWRILRSVESKCLARPSLRSRRLA
jgi:hypothetical protein